jgi:hypothetical protein
MSSRGIRERGAGVSGRWLLEHPNVPCCAELVIYSHEGEAHVALGEEPKPWSVRDRLWTTRRRALRCGCPTQLFVFLPQMFSFPPLSSVFFFLKGTGGVAPTGYVLNIKEYKYR